MGERTLGHVIVALKGEELVIHYLPVPVQALYFLDDKVGWVGSYQTGFLARTDDGGRSWKEFNAPHDVHDITAIFFRSRHSGRIATVGATSVYETNDGGFTWTKLSRNQIVSREYLDYFKGKPLSQWSLFKTLRIVLISPAGEAVRIIAEQ